MDNMEKEIFEIMQMTEKGELQKILACNTYTQKFGLQMTPQDTTLLLKERRDKLKEQERVEFGGGILDKLIFAFCDSPYIYQDNYVDTIGRLQEIFYLYKNESMDELTDDELIEFMQKSFNGPCQGSCEYLEDTMLEKLARTIRGSSHGFIGIYEEDEYEE